jgi:hypothetical protein
MTLEVTEDQGIERQQKANGGTRLHMSVDPDGLVVICPKARITWHPLEAVEVGL